MPANSSRLLRALAREGLDVRREGAVTTVRLRARPDAPRAEVLLPADLPLEGRALSQLARLASVAHPDGGAICRACATPDFHPGDAGIAIGSVIETEDLVVPAAVGTDINCGMRLHVVDLSLDALLARRRELVESLTGDYLLGTRDLPLSAAASRASFRHGLPGLWTELGAERSGSLAQSDLDQLMAEVDHAHFGGSLGGHERWAPPGLAPDAGVVRDGGLATIGGGNHFVEIQVVASVRDRAAAFRWGVREGQVAFMIHSGSRQVGRHIGGIWRDRAQQAWPAARPWPDGRIFPISQRRDPALVAEYLEAEATAANYAFANRALLAELMRNRLRALHGALEAPLVYDVPHNLTFPDPASPGRYVTRKGACPADAGQPVIIPGSMGTASFLAIGLGSERHLCSASHGAGRSKRRFELGRAGADRDEAALGLVGVDCITLKPERRIEEAPAAYKPIHSVIGCQEQAGVVRVVAELRPVMTFKG